MAEDLKPEDTPTDQHSQMGVYDAEGRPYLGDPQVVRQVLNDLIEVVRGEPEEGAIEGAIDDAVEILTGQDDDYAPMGKWNTGDGLGNWIRGHMNGVPDGDTAEAVRYALAHLALHWMDGGMIVTKGTETPEAVARKLERITRNWTYLMVGVPYSVYGALDNVAPEPRG